MSRRNHALSFYNVVLSWQLVTLQDIRLSNGLMCCVDLGHLSEVPECLDHVNLGVEGIRMKGAPPKALEEPRASC